MSRCGGRVREGVRKDFMENGVFRVLRFLDRWKDREGNSGWGTACAKSQKTKSVSLKKKIE